MAIINGVGRVGIRVTSGSSPAPSYLLDTYSGAAGAYSLRKLSSTYSGSAIRVRRSSDNTEMNIGFNSDGSLNTSALLTFVGAGNGFVVIIYDQSGNNINQKQATAAFQSKIVTNGVLETHNGKPVIKSDNWGYDFNNGTVNVNLVYKNMFFVGKVDTQNSTGLNIIISQGIYERIWLNSSTGKMGVYKNDYGTTYPGSPIVGTRHYEMTSTGLNQTLLYVNMKNMNIYMSANGNPETLMGAWGSANGANVTFSMGAYSGDYKFNGKFNEMILWNSDQSSNKSGIETNINSYYSVYTPLDTDASAFISAASITDSTQISAVNTLVTSLKSAGVWNKFYVIRPFVGGTSLAHGLNLKDTSKYTMTFASGISHDSNGINGNGTGYGANNFPYTGANKDSFSVGHYVKSGNSIFYFGATAGSRIEIYNEPNVLYWAVNSGVETLKTGQTTKSGLYVVDRNSANSKKLYRNGSELHSDTDVSTSFPATDIYVLGRSTYTGIQNASVGVCSFFFIASSFTSSEQTVVYNAVQAFQTTLGRQVV